MDKNADVKTIVVTGDVTIDWNIARVQRTDFSGQAWNADDITCAFCQHGGAIMLADVIKAMTGNIMKSGGSQIDSRQTALPRDKITTKERGFHHSYALWAPFEKDNRQSDKTKVWRVREFLGLYPAADTSASNTYKMVINDPEDPDVTIIDDADLGFRNNSTYWPKGLSKKSSKAWILLKMARPIAQGKLWDHLTKNFSDRLIVVMTVNDLRRSQVHISRQISWERTAQDMVWELVHNPHVNTLTQCAHVIVSFGTEGAVLLSRNPQGTTNSTLFFDPNAMEGEWGRLYPGNMIGYSTCLTASIARELILNNNIPDISRGIQSGINAMRSLHVEGYGHASVNTKQQIELAFPTKKIAADLGKLDEDTRPLTQVTIKSPYQEQHNVEGMAAINDADTFWTILGEQGVHSIDKVARQIVLKGLNNALSEVPIGKFEKLITVDRQEIEALHSISSLIQEYCRDKQIQPLSIAVFGPPGSGKSFTVEQVAESVLPGKVKRLNFNLSQFAGIDDLIDAFHQVRDTALSGKIPLVFWDEFDTQLQNQPLGWLRYFLAPMQDGEFQEGQIIHPIGQSIFVFAGGTSRNMDDFAKGTILKTEAGNSDRKANRKDEEPDENEKKRDEKKQAEVKLPDFVSRLKGFLNIMGPNRQENVSIAGQNTDIFYIIRRAIILRGMFERKAKQIISYEEGEGTVNIDEGLLHAFLSIDEYKHGARSMEAVIAMSQLSGKNNFQRSSLPTESQLDLHVDGDQFYALMQHLEIKLDSNLQEKLAEAAHRIFCEDLIAKGYKYGPVTQIDLKEHSSLKPYDELPEDEKEQNRDNIRHIYDKLAISGYEIVPARRGITPGQFTDGEVELLARLEHERWMKQKLTDGWKYAPETVKEKKLHKDLVPWEQLTLEDQDKDYALIRGIPRILSEAGYMIVEKSEKFKPDSYLLEKMAEEAHELFCKELKLRGYKYGPETRDDSKQHRSLRPYNELSEDKKEQNRDNVRDIPYKLASVGYKIVPLDDRITPCQFSVYEMKILSSMEHERWMKQELDSDQKKLSEMGNEKKLDKNLVPWKELSDEEREKDRIMVRNIPTILASVGYMMVKIRKGSDK